MLDIPIDRLAEYLYCPYKSHLNRDNHSGGSYRSSNKEHELIVRMIKNAYLSSMRLGYPPGVRRICQPVNEMVYLDVDPEDEKAALDASRRGTSLYRKMNRWYKGYFLHEPIGFVDLKLEHSINDIKFFGMIDTVVLKKDGGICLLEFGDEELTPSVVYNNIMTQAKIWLLWETEQLAVSSIEYYRVDTYSITREKVYIHDFRSFLDRIEKQVAYLGMGIYREVYPQSYGPQCEDCPFKERCF